MYTVSVLIVCYMSPVVLGGTVGLQLSESPLSEPSIMQTYFEFEIPKDNSIFCKNQVISGMLVWFLDSLSLLYHSIVDIKDILADATLSAAHIVD